MTKQEARTTALEIFSKENADDKKTIEQLKNLLSAEKISNEVRFFCYAPLRGEPDIFPFVNELLRDGGRVAFPKVIDTKTRQMEFFSVVGNNWQNQLKRGTYTIMEPKDTRQTLTACATDVILIPCVAFSPDLYRVGRGKGFYDTWLSRNPCVKIGLARDSCKFNFAPDPHDVQLNFIVTESTIYKR